MQLLHELEEERGGRGAQRGGEETGRRKRREEGWRVEGSDRREGQEKRRQEQEGEERREEGGDRRAEEERRVEVEERRMQLCVVTASRPLVGARLQALASSPGEAAETRQLRLEEKRSYYQRRATVSQAAGARLYSWQAECSRALHVHAANISSGNLNDGLKSFECLKSFIVLTHLNHVGHRLYVLTFCVNMC